MMGLCTAPLQVGSDQAADLPVCRMSRIAAGSDIRAPNGACVVECRYVMSLSPPAAKPKRIGNYKAGPGRPPGRKNNATLRLEEAARQAAQAIGRNPPWGF
jgi:hypothetical protein